jgi:uncharacterized membrane protein required for colicin V production
LGFKRGVIKSAVQLIGICSIAILSYVFKDMLSSLLMKYLPFFNFGGAFDGLTSLNILMYNLLSFLFIFIILYCVLNILLSLSGLIEKILRLTVVLAIPSKILGALLGLIEGIIISFVITFICFHLPFTESIVGDSKFSIILLERTPILSNISVNTTLTLEEANNVIKDITEETDKEDANLKILHTMIYYRIISSEDAQKLIDDGKLQFTNKIIL